MAECAERRASSLVEGEAEKGVPAEAAGFFRRKPIGCFDRNLAFGISLSPSSHCYDLSKQRPSRWSDERRSPMRERKRAGKPQAMPARTAKGGWANDRYASS